MPYLEVSLNGSLFACAGTPHAGVLTASVIVMTTGGAYLAISAMDTVDGQRIFSNWPSHLLAENDELEIELTAEGKRTEPISRASSPELPIAEELARIRDEFETIQTDMPLQAHVEGDVSVSELLNLGQLEIRVPPLSEVRAFAVGTEQLQAVWEYTRNGCKFEVDALSVQADGSTKGRRWICESLEFNQRVRVRYVT